MGSVKSISGGVSKQALRVSSDRPLHDKHIDGQAAARQHLPQHGGICKTLFPCGHPRHRLRRQSRLALCDMTYFTNNCTGCDGGIEFPAFGVGETIQCPHCGADLRLVFPTGEGSDPIVQIQEFLAASSFPSQPSELFLLSRFLVPNQPCSFSSQGWDTALGSPANSIVVLFSQNGLIEAPDTTSALQSASSAELKSMAKARAIPSSGTKEVLAQRLAKSDPDGMSKLAKEMGCLVCSPKGRIIAEKFKDAALFAKAKATESCLLALHERRLEDACTIMAVYEANQVFPRGLGMNWKNYESQYDRAVLEIIFSATLPRLAGIEKGLIEQLKIAAAMLQIFGENNPRSWLPSDYDGVHDLEVETRMILFHALHKTSLSQIIAAGIKAVEILPGNADEDCPVCKAHAHKIYRPQEVPDLPFDGCSCANGCVCIAVSKQYPSTPSRR